LHLLRHMARFQNCVGWLFLRYRLRRHREVDEQFIASKWRSDRCDFLKPHLPPLDECRRSSTHKSFRGH
ncbi:MAG: hypothetical protein MUC83_06950, partial [Pirellula sp.]|nr:hypothetical protein [Pirellula sp.]